MIHAVIPAAGQGKRLGGDIKKQFLTLCDLPVAVHTLTAFQNSPLIDQIICISSKEDLSFFERLVSDHSLTKVTKVLPGGSGAKIRLGPASSISGKGVIETTLSWSMTASVRWSLRN